MRPRASKEQTQAAGWHGQYEQSGDQGPGAHLLGVTWAFTDLLPGAGPSSRAVQSAPGWPGVAGRAKNQALRRSGRRGFNAGLQADLT